MESNREEEINMFLAVTNSTNRTDAMNYLTITHSFEVR
jgi:hypothetical protein